MKIFDWSWMRRKKKDEIFSRNFYNNILNANEVHISLLMLMRYSFRGIFCLFVYLFISRVNHRSSSFIVVNNHINRIIYFLSQQFFFYFPWRSDRLAGNFSKRDRSFFFFFLWSGNLTPFQPKRSRWYAYRNFFNVERGDFFYRKNHKKSRSWLEKK